MRYVLPTVAILLGGTAAQAQTPPSAAELARYEGLHRAAHDGDQATIRRLAGAGADLDARDRAGRTPAHVAAFASEDGALEALAEAGADMNALENRVYDVLTIAAVANDPELVSLAMELGNRPDLVTSVYDGTALIAAAHLGHHEVVRRLSLRHEALAADAIRDALARTTEPGDQDLDLLAARIDLENGRPDEAEKRLVALAETNMPRSVEALMMLLESKLARGETVPPGLTASAEALAFERRAGTDGPALHRLAILSRSAAGNFDAAFQGLSAWPESTPEEMRKATVRGVFAALAKAPDDAALLRGYTARRDLFDASDPDLVLRLDLGDRLVAAGV